MTARLYFATKIYRHQSDPAKPFPVFVSSEFEFPYSVIKFHIPKKKKKTLNRDGKNSEYKIMSHMQGKGISLLDIN